MHNSFFKLFLQKNIISISLDKYEILNVLLNIQFFETIKIFCFFLNIFSFKW